MKVTDLIKKLQDLNTEHFYLVKDKTPMGHIPEEAEVSIEHWVGDEYGDARLQSVDTKFDVILGKNGIVIVTI